MASETRNGEQDAGLRVDHALAALLLSAMALIAFANILGRYLFHYSIAFTEEVTINLFVWLVVIGSGIAFERGAHPSMILVARRLPPVARTAFCVAGGVLSAALFLAVDIYLVRSIYAEITLFHARSPSLGIPVWIYYAGVVACSFFALRGILRGTRTALSRAGGGA